MSTVNSFLLDGYICLFVMESSLFNAVPNIIGRQAGGRNRPGERAGKPASLPGGNKLELRAASTGTSQTTGSAQVSCCELD